MDSSRLQLETISEPLNPLNKPPNQPKMETNKPTLISVTHDDGGHSHWALIETGTGVKLWSENPEECKAQGYPVEPPKAERSAGIGWDDIVSKAKELFPYSDNDTEARINHQMSKRRKFIQGAEFVLGKSSVSAIELNPNPPAASKSAEEIINRAKYLIQAIRDVGVGPLRVPIYNAFNKPFVMLEKAIEDYHTSQLRPEESKIDWEEKRKEFHDWCLSHPDILIQDDEIFNWFKSNIPNLSGVEWPSDEEIIKDLIEIGETLEQSSVLIELGSSVARDDFKVPAHLQRVREARKMHQYYKSRLTRQRKER